MAIETINPKPQSMQKTPQKSDVQLLLESRAEAMRQLAPKHLNIERLIKIALLARNKKKELLAASGESLLKVVMQSAELGLELEGPQGHAYAVPFKGELTLVVGYKGLLELVRRSGMVTRIEAHTIHKNDKHRVKFGLDPVLEHEPTLEGDPGPVIAAYAIAQLKDGSIVSEVMTRAQLDAIENRSQSAKRGDSPWQTDREEMQRKTVLRRICKFLPQSSEMADRLARAIEVEDEEIEARGATIDVVSERLEPADLPTEPSRTEKLKGKAKAALAQAKQPQTVDAVAEEPAHVSVGSPPFTDDEIATITAKEAE